MAGESEIRISTAIDNSGITPGLRETSKQIDTLTNRFDKQALSIKKQSAALEGMQKRLEGITDESEKMELARKIELAGEKLRITRNEAELTKNKLLELQNIPVMTDEQFNKQTVEDINAALDRMIQRENEVKSATDSAASSLNQTAANADNAANSMRSVQYNAQEIQAAIDGIAAKSERVPLDFQAIADSVASIVPPIDDATRNMDGMSAKAQSLLSTFDRQYLAIQQQTVKLYEMKQAYDELAKAPGVEPQKLEELGFNITSLTEKIRIAAEQSNVTRDKFMNLIPAPAEQQAQTFGDKLKSALSGIQGAFGGISGHANNFLDVIRTIGTVGAKGFVRLLSVLKNISKSMLGLNKNTQKGVLVFEKLGNRIKSLVLAAFVFNILRAGLRALSESLRNALFANEQFATSFNAIKVNLLTAFAPIWEVIQPAIISFMQTLQRVTAMLAQFISLLFGKTYEQSKASAEALYEQSNALDKVGKSADKNSKKLASFDKINQLASETADVGGIDFSAVEPPDTTWIDDLKNKFDTIPDYFYGLGKSIAEAIANALESINWDRIKEIARTIAASIAEFINGFIDVPALWYQLGRTISEAINTIFEFLEEFADTLKWHELGEMLAYGLNTAIDTWDAELAGRAIYKNLNGILDTIYTFFTSVNWEDLGRRFAVGLNTIFAGGDWELLGRTFASQWNALINTIYGFVTTFDWSKFGEAIANSINGFFSEIDWAKAAQTLSAGIIGALNTLSTAIENVDWQALGDSIAEFIANIDYAGITVAIWGLIGKAIAGAILLIYGLISDGVKAIGDFFTIEIEAAGGNIALGLWNGILNGLGNIATWIFENIFKPFIDGFTEMFGIASPSTVMQQFGIFLIEGLASGIKETLQSVIELFKKMGENIKTVVTEAWEKVKAVWNPVSEWFNKSVVAPISSFFKSMFDGVVNMANAVKTTLTNIFNGLVSIVKTPFNAIIDLLNNLIGGITSGLNSIISAANNIKFEIPDWVPGIGGKKFGININPINAPKIPRLATGGIVSQATVAMIGERGKEAVLPLDQNTGWMDTLAERIADNIADRIGGITSPASSQEAIMQMDGIIFGRLIVPYIRQELERLGISMSVQGAF